MKRVYIHTWGCQMNEHKSEAIAGTLTQVGYEITDDPRQADVVIFNTCMIREKAEQKVFGKIGEIKKYREKRPGMLLGIGGCMAQALAEKLTDRSKEIDFLFGTSNADIQSLPSVIDRAWKATDPVIGIGRPDGLQGVSFSRVSRFQAYVTITEGCDRFCSFCIVPYTRGRLRSRPFGDILHEVRELARHGYKEATLLGQNVDSYGTDRPELYFTFANLLRALAKTEIARIRFTSSHPDDITPEVMEAIVEGPNICEHIHMAVQSGSDRILKDMRRGYTKAEFLDRVEMAHKLIPGVNITTDIIVGYPGETEADFEETVDLVKRARFGGAFIFKYSPRPGTISYVRYRDGNGIPDAQEQQRHLETLLNLQRSINEQENQKRIGEELTVLAEGRAKTGRGLYGRTRDNKTAVFDGPPDWIGEFVQVRVERANAGSLYSRVLEPVEVGVA
ncbi:MAG: tRNA (N6-isopentenyl adenosine(37)-C2)-methylthiotransferase MiaB [Candidatus Bipolaricaulia bacterium]